MDLALKIDYIGNAHINAANGSGLVLVEPSDRRSVHSLRSPGDAGCFQQKFYIRFFREWRVVADDAHKLLQSVLVRISGLFTTRLIHEVQKGFYGVIRDKILCLHNANYIRKD